jgi:hypothetical protein
VGAGGADGQWPDAGSECEQVRRRDVLDDPDTVVAEEATAIGLHPSGDIEANLRR